MLETAHEIPSARQLITFTEPIELPVSGDTLRVKFPGSEGLQKGRPEEVRQTGPASHEPRVFISVSEAVQAANRFDVILVGDGVFREHGILIEKPLHLVGLGDRRSVIDGDGKGFLLRVTSDSVRIAGLHLTGTGVSYIRDHAAIETDHVAYIIIENNSLSDTFFGIYLAETNFSRVSGNVLRSSGTREANSGNGIHLWSCRDIEVRDNDIRGHRDGIYLEFAKRAHISGNISEQNIRYGLHYMFSDESLYERNVFRKNGAGVAVMYTREVVMRNNIFEDNRGPAAYGLLLKDISDSEIDQNLFRSNTIAIHSEGSNRVKITGNRIEQNGWGMKIMANSQDNHITANNFIENTFDVATNSRRNFNRFYGNYWSQYKGYDLTGNGVGDVPYRPVRLYALIVEQNPISLILVRSFFIDLLDLAERLIPALTPETLIDETPALRPFDIRVATGPAVSPPISGLQNDPITNNLKQ